MLVLTLPPRSDSLESDVSFSANRSRKFTSTSPTPVTLSTSSLIDPTCSRLQHVLVSENDVRQTGWPDFAQLQAGVVVVGEVEPRVFAPPSLCRVTLTGSFGLIAGMCDTRSPQA